MKRRKPLLILLLTSMLVLAFGSTVWGFSDTAKHPSADKIKALQAAGVLAGEPGGKFNPDGKLTYAAGISMIVKGLDLNMNHIRFIKAPETSDYYDNVKKDAWYSQSFIIARVLGVEVPRDVNPDATMTREAYLHYLIQGIEAKEQHAYTMMYFMFKDEADVTDGYMGSIQNLLNAHVIALNADQTMLPKQAVTRGDAAGWLYNAIEFVKNTPGVDVTEPAPVDSPLMDPALSSTAVNTEITKVTIKAQAPHPGYGMRIGKVVYEGNQAIIHMEALMPDPEKMYPMMIADLEVITYVGSEFKPVLAEEVTVIPFAASMSGEGVAPSTPPASPAVDEAK